MTFRDYSERVNDWHEKENCVEDYANEVLHVSVMGVEHTHKESDSETKEARQQKYYWQDQSGWAEIADEEHDDDQDTCFYSRLDC